jgi:NAD(P)-dependent dehydrogenase (short-subunit alcohol dehydrogenase family)
VRGRVVVVTGASRGVGLATAVALAARGATLVLVSRDAERGALALERVRAAGGRDAAFEPADLSSMADVRALAARLLAARPAIHVLVNDAAAIPPRRETTVDGFERQLAVNHLAPFLLTRLLLRRLRASAPSRVVNVASSAHFRGRIDWEDLQSERSYRSRTTYAMTKLANVLFTRELARRLEGSRVDANAAHPGVVATSLLADYLRVPASLAFLTRLVGISPERGARTVVRLASDPALEGVSGRYFARSREAPSSAASRDPEAARRLWAASEALVARWEGRIDGA